MPVIRVSDATWSRLETHAKGFDTPERVIVKMLDALEVQPSSKPQTTTPSNLRPKHTRERARGTKGQRRDKYRVPLMETVYEFGGTASAERIRKALVKKLAGQLDEADHKVIVSTNEPRWWNDVKWCRDDLVKARLFRDNSARGVWELTEAGVKAVEGKSR